MFYETKDQQRYNPFSFGYEQGYEHGILRPLRVGQVAPDFEMEAVLPDGEGKERFGKVSLKQNKEAGKWTVLYFYPRDYTFVCPTEIKRFDELYPKFQALNAELIACSTDSIYAHLNWQDTSLGRLHHPHAADPTQMVSRVFNVLDLESGAALRGSFIISPEGQLAHYSIYGLDVGRNVGEVLRTLEACQFAASGKLMPCEWKPGDETL